MIGFKKAFEIASLNHSSECERNTELITFQWSRPTMSNRPF